MAGESSDKKPTFKDALKFWKAVEDIGKIKEVLKLVHDLKDKRMDIEDVKSKMESLKGHEALISDFYKFLPEDLPSSMKIGGRERKPDQPRDHIYYCVLVPGCNGENLLVPIHELDLSTSESCTPSYRRLPEHYQIYFSSRRTEIGAEVLNDEWVLSRKDKTFKVRTSNTYEKILYDCEDDRCEMDVLRLSMDVAIKHVQELLEKKAHTEIDFSIRIKDHLTVDLLRKNASLTLSIILGRLKRKQKEWAQCRSKWNQVWNEVYAKCYHKSLDFTELDSKNLSKKYEHQNEATASADGCSEATHDCEISKADDGKNRVITLNNETTTSFEAGNTK